MRSIKSETVEDRLRWSPEASSELSGEEMGWGISHNRAQHEKSRKYTEQTGSSGTTCEVRHRWEGLTVKSLKCHSQESDFYPVSYGDPSSTI